MAGGRRARVLIDSALPQLDHLFDYRVPDALAHTAVPGVRVRVPLRNGISPGYLIEVVDERESGGAGEFAGPLAELDSVVSPLPVLAPEVAVLARAVADRQAGSASDVVRLAVPKRQARVERAELERADPEQSASESRRSPDGVHGYADAVAEAIRARQRLALAAIPATVAVAGEPVGRWAVTLAESLAIATATGGVAIAAVPDWRDLDQLDRAISALDPDAAVARLDARRSPADRYRAFLDARAGRARFIIGNRSALYAPAADLRAIAVWDDADPLHAEPLAPYAHARDVALLRQQQTGSALLLAGHTESVDVARLVELGFLQRAEPHPAVRPRIVLVDDDTPARIPSSAWQPMRAALGQGPVLVQVARPVPAPGAEPPQPAAPDVARTAAELGRAFPRTAVVQSHGEHSVDVVDAKPALVVATRGAEPRVVGGYRAVLLLDGRRMLSRESLRVAEDCLRWWSNAAALAGDRAPVLLVGVGGELGRRFALWRQHEAALAELVDRRELRFPPAVRVATVSGGLADVVAVFEQLRRELPVELDWPVPLDDDRARGLVRFDYRYGGAVARLLRAAVIENAVGRARTRGARALRVHLDDRDALDR